MFDPYREADKINEQIGNLHQKNKTNKENALDWLLFTRTVRTVLDIIDYEAKQYINFKYGFPQKKTEDKIYEDMSGFYGC